MNQKETTKTPTPNSKEHFGLHGLYRNNSALKELISPEIHNTEYYVFLISHMAMRCALLPIFVE